MELILREEVPHLGSIGDVVKVKPGYARNYLLPRALAILANPRNRGSLEHDKRLIAEKRQRALTAAQSEAQRISSLKLRITARVGQEGKLYGSVTNLDIERALTEQGVTIERRRIRLGEPIKQVGDHQVTVHLGVGVDANLTVRVEGDVEPSAAPAADLEPVTKSAEAPKPESSGTSD
jgi:large subunit ribosomal protein L9